MSSPRVLAGLGVALLVLGCGPQILVNSDDTSDGDDTTGPVPTTTANPPPPPPPPPSTTVPDPSTTDPVPEPDTSDDAEDDVDFIIDPDTPPAFVCDLWEQDCPAGTKCSPYNNDGGSYWNATDCFPVAEDPGAIGEPCTVADHPFSGHDDCAPLALCFDVDETTLEGTCFGLCIGDESNPSCEIESHVCMLPGDGVGLCLPSCNPLLQDCPEGEGCYPWSEYFLCSPVGAEAQAGDGCNATNGCAAGLVCLSPRYVPGCAGVGCCSSLCTLGAPMPPCLGGQQCLDWYEPGGAPPGLEQVGVCGVP